MLFRADGVFAFLLKKCLYSNTMPVMRLRIVFAGVGLYNSTATAVCRRPPTRKNAMADAQTGPQSGLQTTGLRADPAVSVLLGFDTDSVLTGVYHTMVAAWQDPLTKEGARRVIQQIISQHPRGVVTSDMPVEKVVGVAFGCIITRIHNLPASERPAEARRVLNVLRVLWQRLYAQQKIDKQAATPAQRHRHTPGSSSLAAHAAHAAHAAQTAQTAQDAQAAFRVVNTDSICPAHIKEHIVAAVNLPQTEAAMTVLLPFDSGRAVRGLYHSIINAWEDPVSRKNACNILARHGPAVTIEMHSTKVVGAVFGCIVTPLHTFSMQARPAEAQRVLHVMKTIWQQLDTQRHSDMCAQSSQAARAAKNTVDVAGMRQNRREQLAERATENAVLAARAATAQNLAWEQESLRAMQLANMVFPADWPLEDPWDHGF